MATAIITDNANDTGVSITLSGVSATASVKACRYLGDPVNNQFSEIYSSDSDVVNESVTLATGSYLAVVVDDGVVTGPFGFRVTNGSLGIHERVTQAIREHVLALNLASFPGDSESHKTHKRPKNTFKELTEWSGIGRKNQSNINGVHYWKRPERVRQIMNTRQEVIYPVEFVLVRSGRGDNRSSGDWTHDRELFIQSFPACPFLGVPEVQSVNFRPGVIYSDAGPMVDVQSMQVLCICELDSVAV